jgi:hypothetical protein
MMNYATHVKVLKVLEVLRQVVLVGQRLTLFDFNWGTLTVPFPAPIAAMVAMGSNLVNCISNLHAFAHQ